MMWLFWLLLIVVAVWVAKSAMRPERSGSGQTPREILDERYARGDIDETEYRRRRDEMQQ